MKKYVVTNDHPYYISGLAFGVYDNQVRFLPSGYYAEDIQPSRIFQWVEDGFIKEIQEPEFTKDNMIEFGNWCYSIYPNRSANNKINHVDISQWLSEKPNKTI